MIGALWERTRALLLLLPVLACAPVDLSSERSADFTASGASADPPTRIVLILADDLGWGELGSYGQRKIRTPNLDRLAAEGMRFTQFYAGAPVCAPSRAVLLTGRHSGHGSIRGNRPARVDGKIVEGQIPLPGEERTLAEVLGEQGVATGAFGKWGLGPVGSSGDPNERGFDRFFGIVCQRMAHSYFPPYLWSDGEQVPLNQAPIPGHQRQPEGDVILEDWLGEAYAPDRMVGEALRFLDEHADDSFFLYLPFLEPHVAMHPPAEMVDSYPEAWDDRPYRGQCGYLPHPRPRAGYAAMISDLDEHVGLVLGRLEQLGLAESTLVVFTSDNGTTHRSGGDEVFGVGGVDSDFFDSTGGLRGFKGSVYEGGLRVPLIVRWPGRVEPGSTCDVPAYAPDLFPSLCSAASASVPPGLDGIDLSPLWRGEELTDARRPMVWAFFEYGGQLAVRFGDWKLVHRDVLADPPAGTWELFDLGADPGESRDLAAARPELVEQGVAILRAEVRENELFPVPIPSHGDSGP